MSGHDMTRSTTVHRFADLSKNIVPERKLLNNVCELYVSESEKEALMAEARTYPQLEIKKLDLQWVQTLAEGWASPLRGFMRETEYLQALFFGGLVEATEINSLFGWSLALMPNR
ncbi:hypothetical protein ACTXT7_003130 [Hymenolepis weldensis]